MVKTRPKPLPLSKGCYGRPGVSCQNLIDYDFCYHCCEDCNYDTHRCHFCGDPLTHSGKLMDGSTNPCYKEAANE